MKAGRFGTVFLSFIYHQPDLWTSVFRQKSFEVVRTQFQHSRRAEDAHNDCGEVKNQPKHHKTICILPHESQINGNGGLQFVYFI